MAPAPPLDGEKAGIALATLDQVPLNGLRHRPEAGTSGWYIWGGTTIGEAADFFDPLHHRHMAEYCPAALPFLALPRVTTIIWVTRPEVGGDRRPHVPSTSNTVKGKPRTTASPPQQIPRMLWQGATVNFLSSNQ